MNPGFVFHVDPNRQIGEGPSNASGVFYFRVLGKIVGVKIDDIDVIDAVRWRKLERLVPDCLSDCTCNKPGIWKRNLVPIMQKC